jgi:hypothetical protein
VERPAIFPKGRMVCYHQYKSMPPRRALPAWKFIKDGRRN